jgi:hypothetical protein
MTSSRIPESISMDIFPVEDFGGELWFFFGCDESFSLAVG